MKPIILGILAAFFFAATFILNRSMELAGGSWLWSASLRYFFMLPFLLSIVAGQKKLRPLFSMMRQRPGAWLLWSTVGFGLFYAPLCLAAAFSPGWLIAGTWQITIISGSLLVPLFKESIQTPDGPVQVRGRIPVTGLLLSLIIVAGIVLMQFENGGGLTAGVLAGIIPVLIASFAYPLGNRKMMEVCGGSLNTFQRVLGMTLASLPFWVVLASIALIKDGPPQGSQVFQSFLVALLSGVAATVLFFQATDLVRNDMEKMASVEATQSVSVLFALLGEILILGAHIPSMLGLCGVLLVMLGMILHSLHSRRRSESPPRQIAKRA
ncbi:multidrug resistance efflux transporter family protein [Peribacillus sp. SCS-26]|uniref:DMT family transporter n=1 Tax=Paraperibacillus marinus TaxID=3115295 RepID=UPI003906CB68